MDSPMSFTDVAKLAEEKGDVAIACQYYEIARSLYSHATYLDPFNYNYLLKRSSVNMELGRWCDVESDATNTLILAIDNLQALFRRSLARLKLHKLDMARDDIQMFLRHGGSPSEGLPLLESIVKKDATFQYLSLHPACGTSKDVNRTLANHVCPSIGSAPFVIRDSESVPKQRGVFAARELKRGDLILSEKPVLSLGPEIPGRLEFKVKNLSPAILDHFLSLRNSHSDCSCYPNSLLQGIFHTNSIPVDDKTTGIFLDASRFNHACSPNAKQSFNTNTGEIRIYALDVISAGEEIFISYISGRRVYGTPQKYRRNDLFTRYHFACACYVCTLPEDELLKSDARRLRLNQLWEIIPRFTPKQEIQHLSAIVEGLRIFSEERLLADTADLLNDAASLCAYHSDWVSTKYWANLAYQTAIEEFGEDSVRAEEARIVYEDPTVLPLAWLGPRKNLTKIRFESSNQ